jgi:hypothetical protein
MAVVLSRHNGTNFVICTVLVVWFLGLAWAKSDVSVIPVTEATQEPAEAAEVLVLQRWWQLYYHSLLELVKKPKMIMSAFFTASNLVKLTPLLIPCIWFIKTRLWATGPDSTQEDGLDISDTIGIGKLISARIVEDGSLI